MAIQSIYAQSTEGVVEIFPEFHQGLLDLEGFERIWLIYWFHRITGSKLIVKPFRDDSERGLFATRAPCRPNPIGISVVRLLEVLDGKMRIAGVDVLDGTPLLDIKPYVHDWDAFPESRSGWLGNASERTVADNRFSS